MVRTTRTSLTAGAAPSPRSCRGTASTILTSSSPPGPCLLSVADSPGRIAALVLAGGRASRLGGADKPGITIGGRSLLAAVASAARDAGASRVVVIGPARPDLDSVEFT